MAIGLDTLRASWHALGTMVDARAAARTEMHTWATLEIARAAVMAMAQELAPAGIELLIIKGVYLNFVAAPAPGYRSVADADAVVVAGSFVRATEVLRRSQHWTCTSDDWSTKTYGWRHGEAHIDLHRLPLPLRFGRVRNAVLRQHATLRPEIFGPHVLVPDALDAATISIGNYVKDSLGAVGHGLLARDLGMQIARGDLDADALAQRLRAHGARRIALVAFTALARQDSSWCEWLEALKPRVLERRAASAIVSWLGRHAARHPDAAFMLVRSIADRPLDSALGFQLTALRLARDHVRTILPAGRSHRFGGAM